MSGGSRNTPGGRGWSEKPPPYPPTSGSNKDPPPEGADPQLAPPEEDPSPERADPLLARPEEDPSPKRTDCELALSEENPSPKPTDALLGQQEEGQLELAEPDLKPTPSPRYEPPFKRKAASAPPGSLSLPVRSPSPDDGNTPSPSPTLADVESWRKPGPLSASPTGTGSGIGSWSSSSPSPTRSDATSWRNTASMPIPDTIARFQPIFEEFLLEYRQPGHRFSYYKAHIIMLQKLESFDMDINFKHILSWNDDLACIICSEQNCDDTWLKEAVGHFFIKMNVHEKVGKVAFLNMPTSLKIGRAICTPKESLVSEVTLFYPSQERAVIGSFLLSQIVGSMLTEVLSKLSSGWSWFGKLQIEDFIYTEVLGLIQIRIRKEPETKNATRDDKVLDVRCLGPIVESLATFNGQMPAYYDELKDELLGTTAADVDQPWFHEYLTNYPCLVASHGRRNLETGLYQVVDKWRIHQDQCFKSIFDEAPLADDWRRMAARNMYIGGNYGHENPAASKKLESSEAASQKVEAASHEVKSSEGANSAEIIRKADDRYENTVWGMLQLRRHVFIHPRMPIQDLDECEIYLAKLWPIFLTRLLKKLLRCCGMKKHFSTVWSAYRACKADRHRLSNGSKPI